MSYKLVYFPVRGRAEAMRLLLKDNAIPFNEEVMPMSEKWGDEKPKYTFGQLPALWDGDFLIVQSGAIMRHLARKHGLYGTTEQEMTLCDIISDGFVDVLLDCLKMLDHYDKVKDKFIADLPSRLDKFEKLLVKYSTSDGHFIGNKVTYSDYDAFVKLDMLKTLHPPCLDAFPKLLAFYNAFAARPAIKKHRDDPENKQRRHTGSDKL
jgi:glutathione S-transferase